MEAAIGGIHPEDGEGITLIDQLRGVDTGEGGGGVIAAGDGGR